MRALGFWHPRAVSLAHAATHEGEPKPEQPLLLALKPRATLRFASTKEFNALVSRLHMLARASGRVAVPPLVPCDEEWATSFNRDVLRVRTKGKELRCLWLMASEGSCGSSDFVHMPDFEPLLSDLSEADQATVPLAELLDDGAGKGGGTWFDARTWELGSAVAGSAPAAGVLRALEKPGTRVVWLDVPEGVPEGNGADALPPALRGVADEARARLSKSCKLGVNTIEEARQPWTPPPGRSSS